MLVYTRQKNIAQVLCSLVCRQGMSDLHQRVCHKIQIVEQACLLSLVGTDYPQLRV